MRSIVIFLIGFYQKYISPYKGFHCAHAYLHRGDSCSEAIKIIIEKQGVWRGYSLAQVRLNACRQAYVYITEHDKRKRKKRDYCDVCADPMSVCDVTDCVPSKSCDIPDLPCDCSLRAYRRRWL